MQLWARRRAIWLTFAAALALAACDESAATAEHLQKAQEHSLAGDFPAAIIELKNALQADANNAGARAMLGELYLRTGDPASALKELLRARELGIADDKLTLLVNRARLQTREFQAIVEDVPADQPMSDDVGAELAALRGQALLELGRFAEARETLEKVVATRPAAIAYAGLARIALLKQDAAGAGKHIAEGLAKYPDDSLLTLLKGEQQMLSREFEAAQTTFEALAKAEPNNVMAAVGLVRAELALGRVEPARVVIDDVLEKQPGNLGVILLRSIASLKSGDYAAAQQDANSVLAVDDRNTVALYVAGAASYALEQYEQALRALTTYVAAVPADPAGRKLLAAAQLRMGDAEAAQKTVGSSVDVEDPGYLAVMSSASALKGDIAGGMRYLEQAVMQSPENAQLRTQLGLMRIAAGDPTQGEMDLDQALELDPSVADDPRYDRAEIALIEGYLRKREFDKALTAIAEWQAKHPDDATGYVMAGVAHASKGDTAAARAAFGKALELKPGAPDASANLAILELQANNPKGAELVLQQAIAHYPDDLRTLLLLSQLSARMGDWPKARDWLEKAVAAHPGDLTTRVVLSRIYFNLGQPEDALRTIVPVVREMPDNVSALEVKARAEMETGRLTDAIATYEAIVARYPQAVQTNYELSQAYMAVGNLDKARTAAETAVAAEPDHAGAKLQLARVLLRQRDAASAEGVVADLASAYPNAADVLEIQGDLALLQKDPGRAVSFYRDARKVSDNLRLAAAEARALAADGDGLAATATLEEWVGRNPQDTAARLELNKYLQAGGRLADAEANLREILAYDPDNWAAHQSLARLFQQNGDLAAAHPEAARAYELAPDNPLTMDTLGVILLEQGKVEEATSLLRRASELAPDNPDIRFHLARAYAQVDRDAEARQLLTVLLENFPDFPERERAVALLAELGS